MISSSTTTIAKWSGGETILRSVGGCGSSSTVVPITTTTRTITATTTTTTRSLSTDIFRSSQARVVDVSPLAEQIRSKVRKYTQHHDLKLVGILAHDEKDSTNGNGGNGSNGLACPHPPPAELYSKCISDAFTNDGIAYELWKCPPRVDSLCQLIDLGNNSPDVTGIIIFYPVIPEFHTSTTKGPYKNRLEGVYYKTQDDYFRDLVMSYKDVEGLGGNRWVSESRTRHDKEACKIPLLQTDPCTAKSVQRILMEYHQPNLNSGPSFWETQTVTIINRSEIVGRPLATMLAAMGCTVYSVDHTDTVLMFLPPTKGSRVQRTTKQELRYPYSLEHSDIVVTGVPDPCYRLPFEHIRNATVVNVSEHDLLCNDVLANRLDIQYVPQVGKVTVAILEDNLVRLHMQQRYRKSYPDHAATTAYQSLLTKILPKRLFLFQ
eukprot:Nitzschia sp. Nitz4//scaffold270_size25879//8670//9971//NITZ4_008298-RA/size25879-processed-gene-0.22-mRNA-1//1//CDS//3329545190//9149//frame0